MIQKSALVFLAILFSLSLFLSPVSASHKGGSDNSKIPEENGTYDDPGHPGVKVRVFVHREKPQTSSPPLLVCGLADPDSTAVVSPAGWHLPSSVTYSLNPSSVPSSVGGVNLPTIAVNGFGDWNGAVGGKVTFTRGSDTIVTRTAYDGRNIIAWGRTSGSALGVTYVRYFSQTGLVVDVDTIMNKKFPWKWSNSTTCADSNYYDAENILNHELGHWIGLDDHYTTEYQHNTMYGYGSKGEVKKNTLTVGDNSGAAAIYP